MRTPIFTPEQTAELREQWVANGLDPAAFDQAAGGPPVQDTRTDEQRAYDAQHGGAAPDAYRIEYGGRVADPDNLVGIVNHHKAATAWLSAAGFPELIGPAVIERALDVGRMAERMSPVSRELWKREQAYEFDQSAGSPEMAAERRARVDKVLAKGGDAYTAILRDSGALDDAGVLAHLALQGERLARRPG